MYRNLSISYVWLIIGALCYTCYSVSGQDNLRYNGSFEVGQYAGEAKFDYQLAEGDTVFNGRFQLKKANLKHLLAGVDSYFSIRGNFENNMPMGRWDFQFGDYGATEEIDVVDHHYKIKVDGIVHKASGQIYKGQPDGKWTHEVNQIERSSIEETLFKSVIEFERGIPQKSFRIQNKNSTLIGRFLRDGLAHDAWELFSADQPDAREIWKFTDGRLNRILIQFTDSSRAIEIFPEPLQNPALINLDKRYLEVIRLYHTLNAEHQVNLEGGMIDLLAENAFYYNKIDEILSSLGKSQFMPAFKVKVEDHPLTMEEKQQLDSITHLYQKSRSTLRQLLESTQLHLLKLADEEVLFLVTVLEELEKHHLPVVRRVIEYHQQDVLQFVPRKNLLKKLHPTAQIQTTVRVAYETEEGEKARIYAPSNASAYNFDQGGIPAVLEFAEYLTSTISTIEDQLNTKLKRKEQQQELMVLEEEMIREVTVLNHLTDSLRNTVSGPPNKALKEVKDAAKLALTRYSEMEDLQMKQNEAIELVKCFVQMQELSRVIAKLPDRGEEIKKTYTDEVWNPFTATVMSEEVKKRITMAYKNVVVPYLMNEVSSNLSCDNVPQLHALFEVTHQRMLALREEDTSRLERKLKKEKDPEVVLDLLDINRDALTE
ncbi:MAG: hypothetical protein R3345_07760 [Fulvivirga sp.]|nr:hypothetical protein [Fulvivirga sp.]